MHEFNLGHLEVLDILLEEKSVSKAAQRLHLSPSAISRTLTQIRVAMGDDILTPAGRGLILTARGEALGVRVKLLISDARALLSPQSALVPARIARVFRIRTSDYCTDVLGAALVALVSRAAPQVTLCFVPQGDESIEAFRSGAIDIDLGVGAESSSELFSKELFRDRFVCVGSRETFGKAKTLSLTNYCERPHIIVSRRGKTAVLIDTILAKSGHRRHILATVGSFSEAMLLAARSGALADVPKRLAVVHAPTLGLDIRSLPLDTPEVAVALTWHQRLRSDPEHRWLREQVMQCGDGLGLR